MRIVIKICILSNMGDHFIFENSYRLIQKKYETVDFHIYACEETRNKKKLLLCLLKNTIQNFEDIITKVQGVSHKNLIKIYHFGVEEEHQFIIIEDFNGQILRYDNVLKDLNYQQLSQLTRILLSIYEKATEAGFLNFVFSSQYVIRGKQGEFLFLLFQPRIWSYIQSQQLSLFVETESKRLFWNRSEITEKVIIQDRWYGLLFIWFESIIESKTIHSFLKTDVFNFDSFLPSLKAEFKVLGTFLTNFEKESSNLRSLLELLLKQSPLFSSNYKFLFKKIFMRDIEYFILANSKEGIYQYLASQSNIAQSIFLSQFKAEAEQLAYDFYFYDCTTEICGDFELLSFILNKLNFSDIIPKYEISTNYFISESKYEDIAQTFIYSTLAYLQTESKIKKNREKIFFFIRSPSLIDRKSLRFLQKYAEVWQLLSVQLFFISDITEFNTFQKAFDISLLNLMCLPELNEKEIQEVIQSELSCGLIQSKLIIKHLKPQQKADTTTLLRVLNWFKIQSGMSWNNRIPVKVLKQIENIDNTDLLIKSIVQDLHSYKELLLFFVFVKKPIGLFFLEQIFTSDASLVPLLNFLSEKRVLQESMHSNAYLIESQVYKKCIVEAFDQNLIFAIISQFKSMSNLKPFFDFKFAIAILFRMKKYKDAVEISLKYANYLKQNNEIIKAIEYYLLIIDHIGNYSIDIDKRIQIQILQSLVQLLSYEKRNEQGFVIIEQLLHLLEANSPEKIQFQLLRNDFLLKLDRYSEIDQKNLDSLEKIATKNQVTFIRLLNAEYYYFKERSNKAIELLNQNIMQSGIHESLLERSIEKKMLILTEKEDASAKIEIVEMISHKKRKLVSESFYLKILFEESVTIFHKKDLEGAEKKFNECTKLASKEENNFLLAETYSYLAAIYVLSNHSEKAIEYYKKAIALFKILFEHEKVAYLYGNLSIVYKDLAQIFLAIKTEQSAQELFKKIGRSDEVIISLANMGHIYFLLFDYERAENFLLKAKKLAQSLQKISGFCHASLYLSALESIRGNFSEASKLLLDTINLIPKDDEQNYIHYTYYKAFYDYQAGHYDDAKSALLLMIKNDFLNGNKKYSFIFLFLLGSVLIKLNDRESGEKLLEKSLSVAIRQGNMLYQLLICLRLYEFYIDTVNDKSQFIKKSILRLIRNISMLIKDDVLELTFLQSRLIRPFSKAIM